MAFKKGSRYQQTRTFAPTREQTPPFPGTRARSIEVVEGVLEHTLQTGQRLDLLALHYYNDVRSWWRILDANPHIKTAADVVLDDYAGTTIVIPRMGRAR